MATPLNTASTGSLAGSMRPSETAESIAARLQELALPELTPTDYSGAGQAEAQSAAAWEQAMGPLLGLQTAAQQAAQQAQQEAATAERTPPTSQFTMGEAARTALENLAGVIGRQADPYKMARERRDAEQEALLKNRTDNLTRLRDIATKRAEAAEKMGNDIVAAKARADVERHNKTLERLQEVSDERVSARAQRQREEIAAAASFQKEQAKLTEENQTRIETMANQEAIRWGANDLAKEFTTIQGQRDNIASLGNPDTWNTAEDLVLVRFISRLADPRTGVREEEARSFQEAEGIIKRTFQGSLGGGWIGKGKFTNDGRKRLIDIAERIYKRALARYDAQREQALRRAEGKFVGRGMDSGAARALANETLLDAASASRMQYPIERNTGRRIIEEPSGIGRQRDYDGRYLIFDRKGGGTVTDPKTGNKKFVGMYMWADENQFAQAKNNPRYITSRAQ